MLLFIDTSDHNGLHFALVPEVGSKDKAKELRRELAFNENYKTLELLQKFLKSSKVAPAKLTKIVVCSGPGSFTGIRVGIALAQAMGYALNIPVAAISKDKAPTDLALLSKIKGTKKLALNYGREPNITTAKKQSQTKRS